MHLTRLYTEQRLQLNMTLLLGEAMARRIVKVLRLAVGDQLVLFNPHLAQEFLAVITQIIGKQVRVSLKEALPFTSCPPLAVFLGQGISRGDKMDFTWQKAIELGATDLTPLFTQYCNVQLSGDRLAKRLEHWQGVVISALEQSGRCDFPCLHEACSLATWIKIVPAELKLILAPQASLKLHDLPAKCRSVAILIGSEGGLSPQEITLAQQAGFIAVNLGPRILRTETAALATISALQLKYGDF